MTRSPEKGAHELPSAWTLERFRMKDFGGGHWGLYNRNKRKYMEMTDGAWQKAPRQWSGGACRGRKLCKDFVAVPYEVHGRFVLLDGPRVCHSPLNPKP